jgi:hypothetical protein
MGFVPPPTPPPNFRQNIDCKGLNFKIFRNKDLAPRIALKMNLGQFRGVHIVGNGTPGKLPQSGFYYFAMMGWVSVIGITLWCDEKVQGASPAELGTAASGVGRL